MTQEQSALILLAVMALALGGAWWGWRRRRNSYSGWKSFFTWSDPEGSVTEGIECLYVGTSEAGAPLQRVAVGPLAFRSQATLGFAPGGLVLDARGSDPIVLPFSASLRAGRATWTIDRVVEPDGLLMVQWLLGPHMVDSYFRLVDSNLEAVVDRINSRAKENQ